MKLDATLIAAFGRQYEARTAAGEILLCVPRGKKSVFACGDHVKVAVTGPGQGVIEKLEERRSLLYRSDAWRQKLIAANATQVVLVVATEPSFSDEFLSRCLCAAESQQLKVLIVLNKADLADPAVLDEWVAYYKQQGRKVLALNSKGGKGVKQLISLVRSLAAPKLARWKARGLKNRAVRTMILGIPNVGKSTLINKLSRRSAAKTADKPGETKGKQWVHIGDQLDLLDTPGVLWPKLENQVSAYRLAATGAISDTVFDMETVIMQLIEQLSAQYPDELKARYKLETLCDKPLDTIEAIGRKRGCIVSGGVVDLEKTYKLILKEFREGKIGAISLDRLGEWEGED